MSLVTGADPTGRFVLGRVHPSGGKGTYRPGAARASQSPPEWISCTALRAATSTGSQTGEYGGA